MFILVDPVRIHSRKLITDMVTRFGRSEDSLCPEFGGNVGFEKFFKTDQTEANIEYLVEQQPDFDADKSKPILSDLDITGSEDSSSLSELEGDDIKSTNTYNPERDTTDFNAYYRHLEDINGAYIDRYVGNVAYRLREQSSSSRDFSKKHAIQRSFVTIGDNGREIIDPVDSLPDASLDRSILSDVENAADEFPFTLKRLFSMSRLCKIHIPSFCASYIKAKKKSDDARKAGLSTSQFKMNDVIRAGVWKADAKGDPCGEVTTTSKNPYIKGVFEWAQGVESIYSSYYTDLQDFIRYCDLLNINLEKESFLNVTSTLMSSIIIPTVTSNSQYDKLVADSLLYNGVEAATKKSLVEDDFMQLVMDTVDNFMSSFMSKPDMARMFQSYSVEDRTRIKAGSIALYNKQQELFDLEYICTDRFHWEDGFLYYDDDLCRIVTHLLDPNFRGRDSYCIISETGYLVRVEDSPMSYITKTLDAVTYLQKHPTDRKTVWMSL